MKFARFIVKMKTYFFLIAFVCINLIKAQQIIPKELRCLVCQTVVDEMENEIEKVDPLKKVTVGSYRFDNQGSKKRKTVEYRRSEVYLTELMENVCEKMEDFVRARRKSTGQLVIMPLFSEPGKMNPELGEVDIIQDSDLNKSLKFYCQGILEEFEESFIKHFSQGGEHLHIKLCSEEAKLCDHEVDEDYDFESHEEL